MSTARTSQRPTASTALWAHLLRKDIASLVPPSNPKQHVPTAPIDKAGTSMRLLLHDTQANLERFSERVDKLTSGVEETKREVDLVKRLWEGEREKSLSEMVDLVNRCQSSIQKSVGTPAQSQALESLRKEISYNERRQDALEKRIDALQTLSQTQTHSIQTQTQTLQLIQEQLASIIPAILPLLPLIQSIPSHADATKCTILSGVKESTGVVLDQVKGVSDAVRCVLGGVREEGTFMREATANIQVSLKDSRERTAEQLENLSNSISKAAYQTPLNVGSNPVPNFMNPTSPQLPAISQPQSTHHKNQLSKRPGSPMFGPSPTKKLHLQISSTEPTPTVTHNQQITRRQSHIARSPLSTIINSPTRNSNVDIVPNNGGVDASASKPTASDRIRPGPPRILRVHASFSASGSIHPSPSVFATAANSVSASIVPPTGGGKDGATPRRIAASLHVSPPATPAPNPTISNQPTNRPQIRPTPVPRRRLSISSPSSLENHILQPIQFQNANEPSSKPEQRPTPPVDDFLLVPVSMPLVKKVQELRVDGRHHPMHLNVNANNVNTAKRFIPLDDDSSDDDEG